MTTERFEELKKEYEEIRKTSDKDYEENSMYFKLGTLKAELKYNHEELSQAQILELINILF